MHVAASRKRAQTRPAAQAPVCQEGQTDTGPDRSESAPLAMAHAAGFRIQVAPATALAELAARAELAGGSLAQAAALVPSGLLAQVRVAEKEGQTADWKKRAASASHLAEAGVAERQLQRCRCGAHTRSDLTTGLY